MEVQQAIYVTLLHSLWMGLVLALTTGIVIVATKKNTAVMRYNLLTTLLFAFVVGIGFVFYQSLTDKTDVINHIETITAGQLNEQGIKAQSTMAGTSIITDITSVLNLWSAYSNQIVLIWFLIICAKCIQLMIGLHSIYYLKHNKVFVAGKFWENKVAELSQKLSINKQVRILQSGIAKVPMIAGYFKPVILMPIGMLNGISTAEVEAILSHELAHLKRNDYLVNILQSMIEIVFFFNPAVLWISKLIREEREHCCDDLALSCTESKHLYIKALIACQEFRTSHTPYAMAITGKRNQLKERVSRMLFDNNSTLNKMEKTILTVTLISALTVTAAFNVTDHKSPIKENGTALVNNTVDAYGQPFSKLSGLTADPGDRRGDKYTEVRQDTSKKSQRTKSTVATKTTATTKVSTTTKVNKDIEQQQKAVDLKIKQSITSE
ncbi:MAG: M56 family metallopeptidase, partial [Pedobacter sp.]